MIWDPFERMLWGASILFGIIISLKYFSLAKKNENLTERGSLIGFSALLFCYIMAIGFWVTSEFFIPGNLINNIFYGDYNGGGLIYWTFYRIGYVFSTLSITLFAAKSKIILKKVRYIATTIFCIALITVIVAPVEIFELLLGVINFGVFGFLFYVFYIYTKYSNFEFKTLSLIILLGILISAIGFDYSNPEYRKLNLMPLRISPLMVIFGLIIIAMPLLFKQDVYSKHKNYWLILGAVSILILWSSDINLIILGIPLDYYLVDLTTTSVVSIMLIFIMKEIFFQPQAKPKSSSQNILEMFTKPQGFTEEEVTFHREKKICLVCKNKISRFNYICPDCDVLYCIKCSNALSDLENECWVCKTPFDETRALKAVKKPEEAVELDEEIVVDIGKSLKKTSHKNIKRGEPK